MTIRDPEDGHAHQFEPTGWYKLLSPKIQCLACVHCGMKGQIFGRYGDDGRDVFDGPIVRDPVDWSVPGGIGG